MEVSTELGDKMVAVMSGADQSKTSTFMKVFCRSSRNTKSSSIGIRYHPVIFRYGLFIAAKSSAAHDEITYDEKKVLVF